MNNNLNETPAFGAAPWLDNSVMQVDVFTRRAIDVAAASDHAKRLLGLLRELGYDISQIPESCAIQVVLTDTEPFVWTVGRSGTLASEPRKAASHS